MIKRKSFIGFMIACCLIVSSLFVFTACGKDDEEPKTVEVGSYNELVTAVAGDADIIKLSSDIVVEGTVKVGRTIVLDMNGKQISNTQDIWCVGSEDDWSLISVRENGDLTIKGNGKFLTKDHDCYAVDVMGGKLTIEDGEFVGNISAVYIYDGHADIKGGKYSIQQLNDNNVETAYGQTINIYNNTPDKDGNTKVDKKGTVAITGGVFVNFDPAGKIDNPIDDLVPEGYVAEVVEGTNTDYRIVKASK